MICLGNNIGIMFETYTLRILLLCCIPLTTLCLHFSGGNIMIRPSRGPSPPRSVSARILS